MAGWVERLDGAIASAHSLLCVGLDPDPERMAVPDAFEFGRGIVDATHDLVCAFKLQLAFYEALGLPGLEAMARTVGHIRATAPGVVVIGDAKRGDIPSTAKAYARALFDVWDFDAVTVHAYLGRDSIEPFAERDDRGALIVTRTSNPGARDLQDSKVTNGGQAVPLYERVAELAESCNARRNVGLVVGATYPDELATLRAQHRAMPILVPGVGAQGGGAGEAARLGAAAGGGRVMVSASRSVLYASADPASYAEAARVAALDLRDEIRTALAVRQSTDT